MRRCGMDSSGSENGSVAASCEHHNEPLGSIKGGEFFEWPSDGLSSRILHHGVG
jgi:hypothetical protein